MTDLRTLAQAVVDAANAYADRLDPSGETLDAAEAALGRALGLSTLDHEAAAAILATLDTAEARADAQGYARAMGDVVEYCEAEADEAGYDALGDVADWARERLPAAAEN